MKPLPQNFLDHAKNFAGNEYDEFVNSLSSPPPVSIRINPLKDSQQFNSEEKIPWSSEGRYLQSRPSFTLDPYFHAGCYYVQEASSQFLEQPFLLAKNILNKSLTVLDLCAAPGGKSTNLLSLLGDEDILVSNEIIPSRNNILRQNIIKWGRGNVIVTQNDPSDFSRVKNLFDVVLVDAPCSGEGLFRKDADAIDEWSEENVKRCSLRQTEILRYAVEAVRPGGFLIYCTCTFEENENEKQVESLIHNYKFQKVEMENNFDGVVTSERGLSFFPHRVKGEGFYISLLRKPEGYFHSFKDKKITTDNSFDKILMHYLEDSNSYFPLLKDNRLFAIPKSIYSVFNFIKDALYIRLAGINIGEMKNSEVIPSEAVALSLAMKKEHPSLQLDLENSLRYLRGESFPVDGSKGWLLVRYENYNLGWIKNLGNRMNNYYPKEWRIRKQ